MALREDGVLSFVVACDDPYHKGCREEIGPYIGQNRVVRLAKKEGWYVSEVTNQHSCPTCIGLHHAVVEKKVANKSLTREEARDSSDPFTAAFISSMFGGDFNTALWTTMLTGNNSLGIMAGILAGDDRKEEFHGSGGEFSGAGASQSWSEQPANDVQEEQPLTQSNQELTGPPVIIDPFVSETKATESEVSRPEVKAESESFQPESHQEADLFAREQQVDSPDNSVSNSSDANQGTSY